MQDAQGNPIVVNFTSLIQRIFHPLKNIIRIGRNATDALVAASAAVTAGQTLASIAVDSYDELAVDINVTNITGTAPTYAIAIDRLGADGIWYQIYTGTNITAIGVQSVSLGTGASTNVSFGKTIRIREIVGGTAPSVTRSISIVGK